MPGDHEKARKKVQQDMMLSLEQNNEAAALKAYFTKCFWGWGNNRTIHLEVRVPEGLHLAINDGTGSIRIDNVHGDLSVKDGTGSLTMNEVGGNVKIKDGTGPISVFGVGGDISVKDGTGSIKIRDVAGSVTVNDGVGGINIADVRKDLIIVSDGVGGLRYSNIGGHVHNDS